MDELKYIQERLVEMVAERDAILASSAGKMGCAFATSSEKERAYVEKRMLTEVYAVVEGVMAARPAPSSVHRKGTTRPK